MGFGFSLGLIFIILPLTAILLLTGVITRKKVTGALGVIWGGVFALILFSFIARFLTSQVELDRDDIYGEYVIHRDKFPGFQADWQYNHFRFEIKENDSIYFHETNGEQILKTHKGTISFKEAYRRPRLVIHMEEPGHHIMEAEPALYRQTWSFFYVFKSPKFKSVFFRQEEWEPIDD